MFRTHFFFLSQKKKNVGEEAIRRIREDYPKALDNRLHEFLNKIEASAEVFFPFFTYYNYYFLAVFPLSFTFSFFDES